MPPCPMEQGRDTVIRRAIPSPWAALLAQLKDNQFLVAGFYCRVDFHSIAPDKHRQFLRV